MITTCASSSNATSQSAGVGEVCVHVKRTPSYLFCTGFLCSSSSFIPCRPVRRSDDSHHAQTPFLDEPIVFLSLLSLSSRVGTHALVHAVVHVCQLLFICFSPYVANHRLSPGLWLLCGGGGGRFAVDSELQTLVNRLLAYSISSAFQPPPLFSFLHLSTATQMSLCRCLDDEGNAFLRIFFYTRGALVSCSLLLCRTVRAKRGALLSGAAAHLPGLSMCTLPLPLCFKCDCFSFWLRS